MNAIIIWLQSLFHFSELIEYGFQKADLGLEVSLVNIFRNGKGEIACAESCTCGYISHLITTSTRLSKYFKGSVVCYSPDLKEDILHVKKTVIEEQKAVNEECVLQMLRGILMLSKAAYGIAITGFAGPDGGTHQNPTGTVRIAVGTK